MLKETSLCMGCMNDKTYDGPCKLCGYSEDAPRIPTYLAPKTFLNERYIVGKLLSYNGEGAVYIGFDTVTSTKVTIKEFMPDTLCSRGKGETAVKVNPDMSALYKTYMSEFNDLNRSLIKLRGMAHIQTVLDVFYENNTCYVVFEYITGISLKTYLANSSGSLPWEQVKEIFPPILTTLSLVHAAGFIHRGISPTTIFVTDKMELKLAGFCISAARTTNTEIACEVFSGYAAPEQYGNELNGTWTDVYGIAAVLYRVLSGVTPTEAIARAGGNMPEPMMLNRNVPQNVSRVVMNGLKLSTDARIRTITEFVDKLFAAQKSEEPPSKEVPVASASTSTMTEKQQRKLKKKKKERIKLILALSVTGVVFIAFLVVFIMTLSGKFGRGTSEDSSAPSGSSAATSLSSGSSGGADSGSSDGSSSESGEDSSDTSDDSSTSLPNANISLPDFTNRNFNDTRDRYEGVFVFAVTEEYNDNYEAGRMYDQSIPAGTMVSEGTLIEVKVSKGFIHVALPDYTGKDMSTYAAELVKLGIKYTIKVEKSNEVPGGYIVKCSKEIGDLINIVEGEMVTIYIAENFSENPDESEVVFI